MGNVINSCHGCDWLLSPPLHVKSMGNTERIPWNACVFYQQRVSPHRSGGQASRHEVRHTDSNCDYLSSPTLSKPTCISEPFLRGEERKEGIIAPRVFDLSCQFTAADRVSFNCVGFKKERKRGTCRGKRLTTSTVSILRIRR